MGESGINQDRLYDIFRNTSDQIWDSITQRSYSKINVTAAIDSVVGDDYADSMNSAYDLGSIGTAKAFSGTIGKVDDLDAFRFTAIRSGTATITVDSTHDLVPDLTTNGISFTVRGNQFSFDVVAGQTYALQLGTQNGIGHYQAQIDINPLISAVDLGVVGQRTFQNQTLSGEQWYKLTASRTGALTVEGILGAGGGNVQVELYNATGQLLASSAMSAEKARIDFAVQQHQALFVRVFGSAETVTYRLTNLISLDQGILAVGGTGRDDSVGVYLSDKYYVSVNDVSYSYVASDVTTIHVVAREGNDRIVVHGSQTPDAVRVDVGSVRLTNSSVQVCAIGFEQVMVDGRGGSDSLLMVGSAGEDHFTFAGGVNRLTGDGFDHRVLGFERV